MATTSAAKSLRVRALTPRFGSSSAGAPRLVRARLPNATTWAPTALQRPLPTTTSHVRAAPSAGPPSAAARHGDDGDRENDNVSIASFGASDNDNDDNARDEDDGDEEDDEEDDEDGEEDEDETTSLLSTESGRGGLFVGKTVLIGPEYQAVVPDYVGAPTAASPPTNDKAVEDDLPEERLLLSVHVPGVCTWIPGRLSDADYDRYVREVQRQAGDAYTDAVLDGALALLHALNYAVAPALEGLPSTIQAAVAGNAWSAADVRRFGDQFLLHGKAFEQYLPAFPGRKVTDIVQQYYKWKRSRALEDLSWRLQDLDTAEQHPERDPPSFDLAGQAILDRTGDQERRSRVLLSRRPTPTSGDQPASSDDPESATPHEVLPHPNAAQKFLQPRPRADSSTYPPRKRGRPSTEQAVLLGPIGSPTSSRREATASGGRIRPSARPCDWCRARHHNSPIEGLSLCRECGKAWKISLTEKAAARRRHQAPNGAVVGAGGSAASGPVPSPLSQRPVAWSPSDSPAEGSDTDVAAAAAGSKRRRQEPAAPDAVDDEAAGAAVPSAASTAPAGPWVQGSHLYDLPSRLMAALFPAQQQHVAE